MADGKSIDRKSLAADLRALGLGAGDWVAVHSSVKSIGWIEGGPVSVIDALVDVVGPGSGIMMPLFTMPRGRMIDLSVTVSYLGLMPETFRNYPGVVRSAHPTHSVGIWGKDAQEIAESHREVGYISPGSPWDRLARMGGYVLHIGCDWKSSSLLHLAEVLAEVPYVHIAYPPWSKGVYARYTDGSVLSDVPRYVPGDSAGFVLVQREMERRGMLRLGKVGQADSILARASEMLEVAVPMMKADPEGFLCNYDDCVICPVCREVCREHKLKAEGKGM
jgi:aminoglycoside N3'-acetyltransferase